MEVLPNEILNCVFTNFHLLQKQECMLVCHQWSNIIRSTSLYSTVYISEKFTFKKLAQVLDDNPSYRFQIQSLIVDANEFFTFNNQLARTYFPSVHSIYIKDPMFNLQSYYSLMVDIAFWDDDDDITRIEQYSKPRLFHALQFSKGYIGLTKLVINNPFSTTNVVNTLANSPNINDLALIAGVISLEHIVLLNRNLKALNSLTLDKMTLQTGDKLKGTIATNLIKTFLISFNYTTSTVAINWLEYITKNCPLLLQFRFIFPWTTGISLQKEIDITTYGMLPLVLNIGSQLKYLDISCSEGTVPVLQTLNALKHDIHMIHFRTLVSSNRRSLIYLGELNIFISQLTITLNSVRRLREYSLKDLRMLKRLRIGCMIQDSTYYECIYINQLLDSCPNLLESLEIYNCMVWCNDTNSRSYSLNTLSIHSNTISNTIYQFISYCLPSLENLTINQQDGANTNAILLKDVNLHYLEISINFSGFILLHIFNDNTSHYYRQGTYKDYDFHFAELNRDPPHDLIKQTAPEKILDSEKVMEIICGSTNTFIINKKLAF